MRKDNLNFKTLITGFTIIELVVVISVIGILASVAVLGYGNWRTSVSTAQIKSDLNGVVSVMESARTFNNAYPATIPSSFVPSNGTTVSGGSIDGKSYCIQATAGGLTYKYTNTTPVPILTVSGCVVNTYSNTTPGSYSWTVPASITAVSIEAWGSQGGAGGDVWDLSYGQWCSYGGSGGNGGYAKGTLAVSPGDLLSITIGTPGTTGPSGEWDWGTTPGGVGTTGGASYIKLGATFEVQGLGGVGGGGADGDDWGCWDGATGAGGTGIATPSATLTNCSTAIGQQSGNGKVLISYYNP